MAGTCIETLLIVAPRAISTASRYIYINLDHVSNNKDNQPTTMSPICFMMAFSGRSDNNSLTMLLAWSYIFCWSEDMLRFEGVVDGGGSSLRDGMASKTTFCHL